MNYKLRRKQFYAWIGAAMLMGSLTACGGNVESKDTPVSDASEVSDISNVSGKLKQDDIFSDKDKEIGYSEDSCVTVHLADSASACEGGGVSIEGDVITITDEGTYLLSGTLSNGQIIVDADSKKVRLVMDGVSINCNTSAALYVKQADKVFVTLADNSENQLSNKEDYVAIDDNSIDSVIFSKDDLTLNGNGKLEINAEFGHGIVSKDDLRITSGTYQVTAAEHALEGKDCVAILDGTFTLTSGKDGIHSDNSDDATKGDVFVQDGTFTIDAEGDGIDASHILQIEDGDFQITTGGGSANAASSVQKGNGQKTPQGEFAPGENGEFQGGRNRGFQGEWSDGERPNRERPSGEQPNGNLPDGERPDGGIPKEEQPNGERPQEEQPDGAQPNGERPQEEQPGDTSGNMVTLSASVSSENTTDTEQTVSMKGLKSGNAIYLNGGTLTIDSADDAIHSNGTVQVDGGTCTLSTGDDGVHADEALLVNDGEICVSKSYEGLEGMTITMNGGNVSIVAGDDGMNAAGGVDQSGYGGDMQRDTFGASEDCWIEMNGGNLTIDASGDGIDSNGVLTINGGEIYVSGPENSGNAPLDFGTKAVVNGGTLIATGSSGMAENFDSSSAQCSMLVQLDTTCTGGELTLTDASGEQLASFATEKSYNSVYISCAELQKGETYTLTAGDASTTVELTETNFCNVDNYSEPHRIR